MEHTFNVSDRSNNSEIQRRGRQKGRTTIDVLRVLSPGRQTLADIKMDTDTKLQYGEGTRFLRSDKNQKKSDNTDRPETEKLTTDQLYKAAQRATVGKPYYTLNNWKLEKIPADIQPQGRYDPVRNI